MPHRATMTENAAILHRADILGNAMNSGYSTGQFPIGVPKASSMCRMI
jgi:hypothetical protein